MDSVDTRSKRWVLLFQYVDDARNLIFLDRFSQARFRHLLSAELLSHAGLFGTCRTDVLRDARYLSANRKILYFQLALIVQIPCSAVTGVHFMS